MGLQLVTPPTEEPVSLGAAKLHLRVDHDAEDTLINTLITAARQHAEAFTERALVTQTLRLTEDAFPPAGRPLRLPRPPLAAVESVVYVDAEGADVVWAGYTLDAACEPARLTPAPGTCWPATRAGQIAAVTVTYTAGVPAACVPRSIHTAILLLVGHWYANRETVNVGNVTSELPFTTAALLQPHRIMGV